MNSIKILISLCSILLLIGCSASYKDLSNLEEVKANNFQEYLLNGYKAKAIFEAEKMHDWNSVKLYSEKALKSLKTENIYPEKITYWKLPKESIKEISIAHESLISIYDEAKIYDPYNLANAIVSLDCWSEQQEENWQTWDINKCREDFLNSMHIIYKKITKKENDRNVEEKNTNLISKDDATIVTKNKKNEILQIIYFDFDKSRLSKVSIKIIEKFVMMNKNKIKEYLIIGHTDTKGEKDYNNKLSLKRAIVVRNLLVEYGVELSKIKVLGKGEDSPAILTPDDTKHPANRRVEINKSN